MPKGFSETERSEIEKALIECGTQMFGKYGLKKTSVEEITKAVGIAQGTFYRFFVSKEALFFRIMEIEEQKLREKMVQQIDFLNGDVKENLKRMIKWGFALIEENEVIRHLFLQNEFEALYRKLPKEFIEEHIQSDADFMLSMIVQWQQNDRIQQEDPNVIVGVLRSLFLLPLNKSIVGEAIYPQAVDLLVDFVVEGLVRKAQRQ